MSDDEMPMPADAADVPDDDMLGAGYDEGADDSEPAGKLPEGVTKEVITEAAASEWKKPKVGDEVTVHYVGTLASDGSQFDSSRDRGQPFVFTLGKGQVIKGWDLGVATMKKGEVAKFTLAPEFAYGDAGSPPKIPERATLVFEIELISWASKDDLFGDEGVIKTCVKEGSGWKTPKDQDEVRCSLKALAADGTVVEERPEVEYRLGSEAFGPLSRAVDKALQGMKKGEEASLKCSKDYMYGDERPDGGSIELVLHELYEIKDISLAKDKSLMKKQIKEGEGWDMPKDASRVTLSVEAATDGAQAIPGFEQKTLEFVSGNGEVCDALELAAAEMKKGERAVVTCTRSGACEDEKLGLKDAGALGKVVFTVELIDFEKGKDTWSMSEDEKLQYGAARKEVGSELFKRGRTELALERYKKVADLFNYVDNFAEENKQKAKDLRKLCELNKAACHLKLERFPEAKAACNAVLKEEGSNVKALFRRAQADFGLREFGDCMRDLRRVLELDSQNREARFLLKQALASQREDDLRAKGMFAKMCRGLAVPSSKAARTATSEASAEEAAAGAASAQPAAGEEAASAEGTVPEAAGPEAAILESAGSGSLAPEPASVLAS